MWNGVVTNVGLALLEQWSAGSQTLNIDQATIGTGTVPQANLRASTSVIGEVGPVSIVSSSAVTNGTAYRIQVQPASDAPYVGHQIGIWGSLAGGSSTLLAIYQDEDGVSVPLAADSPGFVFTLYAIVTMSNDGSMTVNTDGGAYITQDDFSTALSGIEQSIATINGDLDGKKFYNSVTDLGLTAGSATLTDTWNAMENNSMGLFSGNDFPVSELPGSTQTGIVIIHRWQISRGIILWASKNQTDGTKNQLCVMQWSSNSPSGVWRDIANLTAADVEAVAKAGDTMTGSLATPTPLNITSPSGATRSEINFGRAGQSDVPNNRAGVLRYDLNSNQWKFLQVTGSNSEVDSFYLPATDFAATSGSAYGIFTAKDNARTGFYQLNSGGSKCTLTLNNNVCMFAISRNGTSSNPSARCVCVAEYWGSTIAVFGELPSQVVLQKSANSNVITIQNNRTTGVVLTCVSGIFAAVDGTDPITQTATLINYNYYMAGDTYSVSGPVGLDGYIGSGATNIYLTVVVPKLLTYVDTVTVTRLVGQMRGVNGTIASSGTTTNWLSTSGVAVSATIFQPNMIRINLAFDTAAANATAQTVANLAASLTLSFS